MQCRVNKLTEMLVASCLTGTFPVVPWRNIFLLILPSYGIIFGFTSTTGSDFIFSIALTSIDVPKTYLSMSNQIVNYLKIIKNVWFFLLFSINVWISTQTSWLSRRKLLSTFSICYDFTSGRTNKARQLETHEQSNSDLHWSSLGIRLLHLLNYLLCH